MLAGSSVADFQDKVHHTGIANYYGSGSSELVALGDPFGRTVNCTLQVR